jgi:hypothetical protein
MKQHIKLLLLIIIPILTLANEKKIVVKARPLKDRILLRWAPNHHQAWQIANKNGYLVYRYTILRDKKLLRKPEFLNLTPDTLKLAPKDEWRQYAENEEAAMLAAGAIFTSSFDGMNTKGNVMMAIRKYQELEQRFGFALMAAEQSRTVANLSALFYEDVEAKKNEKYLYRVIVPNTNEIDTGYVFTGITEYAPLPKPLELSATWGDHHADIRWNKLYLKRYYSSYYLEKSEDGKTFTKVTEKPITNISKNSKTMYMFKSDSLEQNFKTYYYRVIGINSFGELSPYSDTISGYGYEPVDRSPVITQTKVIENKHVELKWLFPHKFDSIIQGFKIYRTYNPNNGYKHYETLSSTKQRSYIDSFPEINNYYKISVLIDSVEEKRSFENRYAQLIDSFPPMPPIQLSGNIDTNGLVKLSWANNTEKDLKGYRIYRANDLNEEFGMVSNQTLVENKYTETISLNNLTSNIYYKLSAVDIRGNNSKLSEALELTKPDKIAPVSPFFVDFSASDSGVYMSWINSTSKDVVKHELRRSPMNLNLWKTIKTYEKIDSSQYHYFDNEIDFYSTYSYEIYAFDKTGNKSKLVKTINLKRIDLGLRDPVSKLEYEMSGIRSIKLSWQLPNTKEKPEKVIVYYKKDLETEFTIYKKSDNKFNSVNLVLKGKKNYFKIKILFSNNKESKFSKIIEVNI